MSSQGSTRSDKWLAIEAWHHIPLDIQRHATQAPKWEFPIQDIPSQQSGASDGALYLGSLPGRPPAAYTAILPFRPNSMPKGANAVLGFGLGSREPHLTLVLDGEPVLTLTHQHAFFHSILLLLQVLPSARRGFIPFPETRIPKRLLKCDEPSPFYQDPNLE